MKFIKKHFLYFKNIFFLYIKITNNYHQKHKGRLRKEARVRYQNLSEEEKNKRQKSPKKDMKILLKKKKKSCNKNLSEEQKQGLVEYRRNYYLTHNK